MKSQLCNLVEGIFNSPEFSIDKISIIILGGEPNKLLVPLINFFEKHEEFDIFNDRMQFIGGFGNSITYEHLAIWLMRRADGVQIEKAVEEVLEYVRNGSFELFKVMWLNGISINQSFELIDGYWLINTFNFPVDSIRSKFSWRNRGPIFSTQPEAVIIKEIDHPVMHLKSTEELNYDRELVDFQAFEDIRLCMTLIRKNLFGVQAIGTSLILPDSVPTSHGLSYSIHNYRKPNMSPPVIEIEVKSLRNLYSKFKLLDERKQERLRVILQRLNDYVTSSNQVEKAITIRILLESLFLEDSDQGELSFQLALRISRMFGKTVTQREEIFGNTKKTYNICSRAVHNGVLSEKEKEKSKALFEEALSYVRKMTLSLLNGEVVEWKKLILE